MRKNLKQLLAIVCLLQFIVIPASATQVGDSIDTYNNHTVTTSINLQGRDTITSSYVTVTPTGHLTLSAPNGIVINSNFEVQLGGRLNLNGGSQWPIRYTHDASGNATSRKKE